MNGPTFVAMLESVLEQFPGLQGRKRLLSTGNLLSAVRSVSVVVTRAVFLTKSFERGNNENPVIKK